MHLNSTAPVALATVTLYVAGVWWRTNAQKLVNVRILTSPPDGSELTELRQTNVQLSCTVTPSEYRVEDPEIVSVVIIVQKL